MRIHRPADLTFRDRHNYWFLRCPRCENFPLKRGTRDCEKCRNSLHQFTLTWADSTSKHMPRYKKMAGELGKVVPKGRIYSLTLVLDSPAAPIQAFTKLATGSLTIGDPDPFPGLLRLANTEMLHCGRACIGALASSWHAHFFRDPQHPWFFPEEYKEFAISVVDERDSYHEPPAATTTTQTADVFRAGPARPGEGE